MMVGVNGTGKTTTAGKLAAWYRARTPHRPALRRRHLPRRRHRAARSLGRALRRADDQDPPGRRPLRRALRRRSAAKAHNTDELIVDTAGRLHTKTGLMDELDKMRRTAAKLIPGAPHQVLLVMDATTGQNGLQQARLFTEAAGVTGIVLTKLDGTAKGGIAVAIAPSSDCPSVYAGIGEKIEDLMPFELRLRTSASSKK
jgi:fused signal recognition particle receptor